MDLNEDYLIEKIVDLIKTNLMNKRWLYYPPGPMTRQVIDKELIKSDISKLIKGVPFGSK